jgi:hypothetical protein
MTTTTATDLELQLDHRLEQAREFARQIESGEYGNQWTVRNGEGDEIADAVIADHEDEALEVVGRNWNVEDDWEAERNDFDEPTIVDECDNHERLSEWPLEVVVKIGRPLAVLLTVGGPYVAIEQDLSDGAAKLIGHWGGESKVRRDAALQTVLDYFTDDIYDMAPEEYK